jgi:hypothetical protein
MEEPNVYKARLGLMNLSHRQLASIMEEHGIKVSGPEISLALNGGRQAKHRRIREFINLVYCNWREELVRQYDVDFSKLF